MARTDRSWSPGDAALDWIEDISGPPHPVLLEMEAAAEPEGIPILNRDSGRMLAVLAAGRRRAGAPARAPPGRGGGPPLRGAEPPDRRRTARGGTSDVTQADAEAATNAAT